MVATQTFFLAHLRLALFPNSSFEFSLVGFYMWGPTKSLTFSKGPKFCQVFSPLISWGFMIQFDLCIFFHMGGSTTNQEFIIFCWLPFSVNEAVSRHLVRFNTWMMGRGVDVGCGVVSCFCCVLPSLKLT